MKSEERARLRKEVERMLRNEIREILDDPINAITDDKGLRECIEELKLVAQWLEVDWDLLLKEEGSDSDRQHLARVLENSK